MWWLGSLALLLAALASSAVTVIYMSSADRLAHEIVTVLLWIGGFGSLGLVIRKGFTVKLRRQ